MRNHQVAYGHGHLHRTIDQPIQDFEGLRRETNRVEGVPGSASTGPSADPRGLLSARMQTVTTSATILEGVVHYVIPGAYTYRVILDGELGELICGDMMNASFTRSVRISQILPVGTRVLVLKQQGLNKGMIIGAPAREVLDYQYGQPVLASAIGRFHVQNRQYVRNVARSPDTGRGIPDYVQGRAVDVCEGDYMITNLAEGGFFTSPFETSVRQTHDCGVWMFSMDRLLRLAGRSVQEYSVAHERYAGMDEHETHGFEGTAGYPWEALGYYRKPDQPWKKNTGTETVNGKGISFMEPDNPNAEPFYRRQVHTGYLGQGYTHEIRIPPKGVTQTESATPNLPDDGEVPIVVAREQILPDGAMIRESARAIHSVKHANIRSFKRIRAIDDPRGDDMATETEGKYEFSAAEPAGTMPQSVTDQVLWTVRNLAPALFRAHRGDFLPIERDGQAFEQDLDPGDLSTLASQNSVEEPLPVPLFVDERFGEKEYRAGRSTISQLENGDIVFRNACGAEIALRGSNIELSAPGDFRVNMGRSVIMLAGDDLVVRAKNSIDLTATDNDVRVKARRNCDLVAGTSGTGRMLIESQAVGTPGNRDVAGLEGENINGRGIVLKAKHSTVQTLAQRIYLRSLDAGTIVVDADAGRGTVKVDSYVTRIHGSAAVELAAGITSRMPNLLSVTGSRTISKATIECHAQILALGAIFSDAGVVTTPADNFSKPPDYPRYKQMEDRLQNFIDAIPTWFQEQYWSEDQPGHEETIRNTMFSYRTTDQYGSHRFLFGEPFWMELYGEDACATLATWDEPVYRYQETSDQQPWPGYDRWTTEPVMTVGETRMYDAPERTDRDEPDESATRQVIPGEYFRIIDPP
jgi:hypothetical protein